MKIEITAQPIFWIEFDTEQLASLLKMSANHYDSVCKSASKTGGFILGWYNSNLAHEGYPKSYKCKALFREIDITLKILEDLYLYPVEEANKMQTVSKELRDAVDEANRRFTRNQFAQ